MSKYSANLNFPDPPMFGDFHPSQYIRYGPGPSIIGASVMEAMGEFQISHVGAEAMRLQNRLASMARFLFQTRNGEGGEDTGLTTVLPLQGSGAMQVALEGMLELPDLGASLAAASVESSQKIVIAGSDLFPKRLADMVRRLTGKKVHLVENEPGRPVDPDAVDIALATRRGALLAVVSVETSTGAANPIGEILKVAVHHNCPTIVDAVTAFPSPDTFVDSMGEGANSKIPLVVYSCGQKGLGGPPSASPITMNSMALERLTRGGAWPTWIMDVPEMLEAQKEGRYRATTPMILLQGLDAAMVQICRDTGLSRLFDCQCRASNAFEAAIGVLSEQGAVEFAFETGRSRALKAVKFGGGNDFKTVIDHLYQKKGVEIAPGADWARIGLLSPDSLLMSNLLILFQAICESCRELNIGQVEADPVMSAIRRKYAA